MPAKPVTAKSPDLITIAHISDLHFTDSTSASDPQLEALKQAIVDPEHFTDVKGVNGVDVLAVTGDIVDSALKDVFAAGGRRLRGILEASYRMRHFGQAKSWNDALAACFGKAKTYFEEVCDSANIDKSACAFVVPGNHDARIKGLMSIPFTSQEDQLRAFYSVFGSWAEGGHTVFNTKNGRKVVELATACLNSNDVDPYVSFATGRVGDVELNKLAALHASEETRSAFKLALLHHHPMPIPECEVRSLMEDDAFLLLKNAGLLMRELVRGQVDLVLHGHKHHAGYTRVSYPRSDDHEVTIVAAGNSALPSAPNYFNLIQVSDAHAVRVVQLKRDASGTFAVDSEREIVPYEAVRKRLSKKRQRAVEMAMDRYLPYLDSRITDVAIDRHGDAIVTTDLIGLRGPENGQCEHIPWTVLSTRGYGPTQPKIDALRHLANRRVWWESSAPAGPGNGTRPDRTSMVKGQIRFSPPITHNESVDLRIVDLVQNGFHMIAEYKRLDTPDHPYERMSVTVGQMMKRLTLTVSFEEGLDAEKQSTWAQVVDAEGNTVYSETRHIGPALQKISGGRIASLSVGNPIPDFRYWICWDLLSRDQYLHDHYKKRSPAERAEFQHLSDELRNPVLGPAIRDYLIACKAELIEEFVIGGTSFFDEDTSITLMAFDDSNMSFYVVASTRGSSGSTSKWSYGEGLVGQAHRRNSALFFDNYSNGLPEASYYKRDGSKGPHSFLICIPVGYPVDESLPDRLVLGVVNISSARHESRLRHFFSDDELVKGVGRETLVDLANTRFVTGIGDLLSGS
jgi:3',5'-cyclic AMP phosphodiesterase CpdA